MRVNNRMTYHFDQEGNRYEHTSLSNSESQSKHVDKEVDTSQSIEEKMGVEEDNTTDQMLYGLDTEQIVELIRKNDQVNHHSNTERQTYERDIHEQAKHMATTNQADSTQDHVVPFIDNSHSEDSEDYLIDTGIGNGVTFIERKASSYTASNIARKEREGRSGRAATRKMAPTWGNVLIAVFSALATGTIIGYMILTLMFGQKMWPLQHLFANQLIDQQYQSNLPEVQKGQQGQASTVISSVPSVTITPIEYNYHLLQHGVFNQENTRDEAISLLNQRSYASAFTIGNDQKYYLYTGIASSAAHMLPISEQLSAIETYRKEFTIEMPQQLEYYGTASELEQYIQFTNRLIMMFADITSVQFEQTAFSPLGSVAQEAWEEQFKLWEEQAAASIVGFTGTKSEESITAINEQLQLAKQHLAAYQSKPAAKEMWKVQAAVLQAVLKQKEWIDLLNTLS